MADDYEPTQEEREKAFAYIGRFLFEWAYMEFQLNGAIGKALSLTETQKVIVCKNIQLRDKINILRTLVSISKHAESEKADFDNALLEIAKASSKRNMVAHDPFLVMKDGGVSFYTIKARGTFSVPENDWEPEEFAGYYEQFSALAQKMKMLGYSFKGLDERAMLALALAMPSSNTGQPAPFGFLGPLTQSLLGSHPPNPAAIGEIPPFPLAEPKKEE